MTLFSKVCFTPFVYLVRMLCFINLLFCIFLFAYFIFCGYCLAHINQQLPGRVAQSVTCLATDSCLTADPGVASLILVRSHTFVEIMKLFLGSFSYLPLIYSRRVVVSYKRKYVHELLVNCLFKPVQEKLWLGELTIPP